MTLNASLQTAARLLALASVSLSVVACPKIPEQTALMRETGRVTASATELRARMGEFGRRLATYIEVAADSVIASSDDGDIQRGAILLKLSAIPAAHDAALRSDPLIAGIDTWALIRQLLYFVDSPDGDRVFGEHAFIIRDELDQAYDELTLLSEAILTGGRDTAMTAAVDQWVLDHPITDVPFVRPSLIGEAAALLGVSGGGIGEVFVSLEGSLDRLEQRVAYLSETAFKQAVWAGQIAVRNGLEMDETTRFFDLMDASTNLLDTIPPLLAEHRDAVIDALGAERYRVLLEIERLRSATMEELKVERQIILDALRDERAIVMDGVSSERAAVMAGIDSVVQRVVERQYSVIDRVFWRLLQLAVVVGVLAIVAVLIVHRLIAK
jgi:hypothetical protein